MARAKKKADVFQWDRTSQRVQSLGGGTALRVFDHVGCAWVVRAGDIDAGKNLARLIADIRDADADCADRIVLQLPVEWADRYESHAAGGDVEDVEVVS